MIITQCRSELGVFVSLGVRIRGEFRRLAFLAGLQLPVVAFQNVDEVRDAVFVL